MTKQGQLVLDAANPSDGEAIVGRPYQIQAIDALMAWWHSRPVDELPVVVLPTASGKTIIFSLLIRHLLEEWPGLRVLILAHRQELLDQAEAKLLRVWPQAQTGVYCAGLGRKELEPITIASRDSIASLDLSTEHYDVVIIDEAHRIGQEESTRYLTILRQLREGNPRIVGAGFTATPYRTDSGYVYGNKRIFRGVAYEKSVREMIAEGYLAEIRAAAVTNQIDVSGVRTQMGDYNQRQLGERAAQGDLLDRQLDEWEEHAANRGSTVFFCVNVEHAEMVQDRLLERDIIAPALHAKTDKHERARMLQQFEDGEINGIANVGVLTEGWDCPRLDCITLLRPTKSLGLFIQMVGRGLRPSPETGKEDCLLLDFGGCLQRFGPIDRAKPAATGRQKQESRVKTCDGCGSLVPSVASTCPHCGHEFGCMVKVCDDCGAENRPAAAQCEVCGALLMPKEVEGKASTRAVLSNQEVRQRDVQCFEVESFSVEAATSSKGGRYLRINYDCGAFQQYNNIVCLGYKGWPGRKAMRQMRAMLKDEYVQMPETDPDTFLQWHQSVDGGMLRTPRAVYVDLASEWSDVTYVEYWTDDKAAAMEQLGRLLANVHDRNRDDIFDDDIPF